MTLTAAVAYEAGMKSFARWAEHEGTTKVVPSLFHVATWMQRGLSAAFRDGWFAAREIAEGVIVWNA